ncbi:unnamed protein product [Tilletia controversa]|uniref:Ubiquitin-like-conjugating enzyme ATG10 n=3 Tax=Tilletia TaxID=13289 RepID=A0A8X7SYH6_9BASI|nr:hypothetical protein CF336_g2027 [Tilletia laevis]KAE8203053.1 hypothetical protein CF328_g1864 [Tilletia controversa]KAE8263609.1 hypothetical protein A4X03_0g1556 [Tilletia caries]KAE8207168.1 hypothetical protein CF335_g1339 [Tilletia laevis]KAE8252218.1 hypothetical protein A4X06_0g2349 [Tilletia controversa]
MPGVAQISCEDFLTACRAFLSAHSRSHSNSSASADRDDEEPALGAHLYSRGWTLNESKAHFGPHFSYLYRSLPVQVHLNALDSPSHDALDEDWLSEAEDLASVSASLPQAGRPVPDLSSLAVDGSEPSENAPIFVTMSQSVCYSTTWRVPVFYFSVSRSDGSPLTLEQVIRSSIVQHELDPLTERAGQRREPSEETSPQDQEQEETQAADLPATFAPISSTEHPVTAEPVFYLHPCETSAWLETLLLPQVARREARSALARTSSSSMGSAAGSASHDDIGSTTVTAENPSSASASASQTASSSSSASTDKRTLCSYLETFVALVASAIEMRL